MLREIRLQPRPSMRTVIWTVPRTRVRSQRNQMRTEPGDVMEASKLLTVNPTVAADTQSWPRRVAIKILTRMEESWHLYRVLVNTRLCSDSRNLEVSVTWSRILVSVTLK